MEISGEAISLAVRRENVQRVMEIENVTKDWIMISTPVPMLLTLVLYGLILTLGPKIMENRAPFKLKSVMRFYNIFQVIHNLYMVYSFAENPDAMPFVIQSSCSSVTVEDSLYAKHYYSFNYYSWHYLVSKHIDLLDTVFMVLRKKNSHITFLHVYHHFAMVFFSWLTITGTKSIHAVIPGAINVIVHSIMYSYYFLATFSRFKHLLWWKHHLTKLQLGQFVIILLYICSIYYYGCPIDRKFTFTWSFNVFVILVLFINFYVKSYMTKPKQDVKESQKEVKKSS
ncbi:elongation of very long chain fatty acids protein 7-like [Macrosteles quadrilineatus]|uniref:elongation of very long chain fatty acids protein 7-like n=1 Tax=Macrosteles quadrilineatus TaxID=74068 RepID=UPI0023E3148A|nr:elongation of very long chain fatty acids protein 7-like [Macrosteles quadrilineatus]